jgi:polyferredoxin
MQKLIFIKQTLLGSFRNRIQLIFFIMTIAMGIQFYLYVHQILGNDPVTIPRPAGVEGFLPIGALMGWKYFLQTGVWENTHPAAMVILGFAVMISLLIRRSFCSWFCPVGTLSEWAWKIGEFTSGKTSQIPAWMDLPLRSVKYILLGFFLYIILSMSPPDLATFFQSPYYKIADVKMLHFFTKISMVSAFILLLLTVLSFIFRNFWCRYACPYGALLGLFSVVSPTRIRRKPTACSHCRQCARICPSHLPVDQKEQVISPECSSCMDCVSVCPAKNALELKPYLKRKAITTPEMGWCILFFFFIIVYLAGITGHWKSMLSENESRMWLKTTDFSMIQHPSIR